MECPPTTFQPRGSSIPSPHLYPDCTVTGPCCIDIGYYRAFSRLTLLINWPIDTVMPTGSDSPANPEHLHNVEQVHWMVAPQTFKYVHDTCVHVPLTMRPKACSRESCICCRTRGVPLTTPQHATQQISPNLSPRTTYPRGEIANKCTWKRKEQKRDNIQLELLGDIHGREKSKICHYY